MRRADAGVRGELEARLEELARRTPEWRVWIGLLGETLRALEDPAWSSPVADPGSGGAAASEGGAPSGSAIATGSGGSTQGWSGAPLLHGRILVVDVRRLQRFVRRLAEIAAYGAADGGRSLVRYRPPAEEALRLVAAAVREHRAEIAALAGAAGVDAEALGTVGELSAVPLLHSCGRLLRDRIPLSWPHGYCPICGRWPVLAELRGLRGARRLRCARCGGDWQVDSLWCVYCGERDHERLGSLASEQKRETLRLETCKRCGGFLKSVATLQAIPAFELFLRDLETVELDLVALERGYSRPRGSGFALEVQVTPRASRVWR